MKTSAQNAGRPTKLGAVLLAAGLLLVINSAYLAAFGDPSIFYVANSLVHPLLGVVSGILFGAFLTRNRNLIAGLLGVSTALLLAAAGAFGIFLAVVGMTRPHSLALYMHVACAIAGLFLLLIQLRRHVASYNVETRKSKIDGAFPPQLQPSSREFRTSSFERAWRWCAVVMPACLLFYGGVTIYHRNFPNPEYNISNPATPPLTMEAEGGGTNSFMFPSSAQTPDGKPIKSEFFMDSNACQKCHADIYDQWKSSMHHIASFNNQWYRKSIEYMQDTIGIKSSMWCAGCHDHALALSDMMQARPIREIEFTKQGQNGLGCMSCHAIVHVAGSMGQGGITFEYPALSEYAASKNPIMKFLHDYQVYLDPKPHRNAFMKPFHTDPKQIPDFCSACHKVHLDVPVNNYRWIRGFDDYDNWQASGVSGQGARSFYYPPEPKQCADCHMPLVPSNNPGNIDGYVHSHRFATSNTAVPTAYDDQTQLQEVEKFLKGTLSVDIFALAEEPSSAAPGEQGPARPSGEGPQLASTFAVGEESSQGLAGTASTAGEPAKLIAPLGRVDARLHRGETARVEVVVRTRKLGHFFPGGTVDAFDCWLELQARDNKGRVIFWSGEAADNGKGPVDPGAHFYRSLQLDAHGNVINKRNAWATRAVVYARLIPPGAADTAHFRLKVPEDCGDNIAFMAKLNYRKFSWINTQFAFGGVRDPNQPHPDVTKSYDDGHWLYNGDLSTVSAKEKKIPDVPIVVIAQDTKSVPVEAKNKIPFVENVQKNPKDRERWNDYGIGLLLQGDLKGAERAFQNVSEVDPKYADGFVNVARARIQEGNTDAAKPALMRAIELNPKLASARYFYGLALKADGKYPEAYDQFAMASALYPRDRVVRNQMGRMLFLQRKYQDALAQYAQTMLVDPEDLEAHYNMMLCYRGLNNDELANREEKLYMRFKFDESSRAITGPFALAHPEDNNEAQPIHEHESVGLNGSRKSGARSQKLEARMKKLEGTAQKRAVTDSDPPNSPRGRKAGQ
ncbi:MAG TPA: tetratricopeptide repeat protein [Terriglobia bacterium]|nr:tetratricopeptide repeat protein [Terriglobia bacterium]